MVEEDAEDLRSGVPPRTLPPDGTGAPGEGPNSPFGPTLRAHRTAAGLSQHRLAKLADISMSYVSLIERGRHRPAPEIVERLAAALASRPRNCTGVRAIPDRSQGSFGEVLHRRHPDVLAGDEVTGNRRPVGAGGGGHVAVVAADGDGDVVETGLVGRGSDRRAGRRSGPDGAGSGSSTSTQAWVPPSPSRWPET